LRHFRFPYDKEACFINITKLSRKEFPKKGACISLVVRAQINETSNSLFLNETNTPTVSHMKTTACTQSGVQSIRCTTKNANRFSCPNNSVQTILLKAQQQKMATVSHVRR
jgi:hypothetical protein